MKHARLIATTLAIAVCLMGISTLAYAADPMKGVEVTGKVAVKADTKDGKTMKTASIAVASAKGADGKEIADLKGKTLTVTGGKVGEAEKLADKEVTAKGTVAADKASIELESIAAKAAPKK